MSHLNKIRISKNGKLFEEVWENQQKQDKDITKDVFINLLNTCYIEDGVILKDILLLTQPYATLLSPLLTASPNWLQEIIEEGLNNQYKEEGEKLEYLELSWNVEVRKYKGDKNTTFDQYIHFNGKGKPNEYCGDMDPNELINYAIGGSPLYTLSEIPVRLNTEYKIMDARTKYFPTEEIITAEKEYSLLDILHGIFWELSFMGGPKQRDELTDELKRSIEEIENGTAELKTWDEVKEGLKLNDE